MAYYDQITMMRLGLGRWSGHDRTNPAERKRWQGRNRPRPATQALEQGQRRD